MLASFNSTAVAASAVTALTAIIVSLIGYRTSRLTSHVAERQIDAESVRHREQLNEPRRRERQDVYRAVLNGDHNLLHILDQPEFEEDAVQVAYTALVEAVNDAIIFGTADVAQAAQDYQVVIGLVIDHAEKDEELDWHEAAVQAKLTYGGLWMERRAELFNAIRRDVAVDHEEIRFWTGGGPVEFDDEAMGNAMSDIESDEAEDKDS